LLAEAQLKILSAFALLDETLLFVNFKKDLLILDLNLQDAQGF